MKKLIGSGLVVALLTLVPVAAAAQETVVITGGFLASLGRYILTPSRVTGTHGFDMKTVVATGPGNDFASMEGCHNAGGCTPGMVLGAGGYIGQPNTILTRDTIVRLEGEEYTDFDGNDGNGFVMQLSGQYTAPPYRGNRTITVRTPVTLRGGGFSLRPNGPVLFAGNAIATIVLEPPQPRTGIGGILLPVDLREGWTVKAARYDFYDPAVPIRWTPVQLLLHSLDYVGLEWSEVRALGACRLLEPDVDETDLRQLLADPDFRQLLREYHITAAEFAGTVRWAWGYRTELASLCQ